MPCQAVALCGDAVLKEALARPEHPWVGMVVADSVEDLAAPHPSSCLAELGKNGIGLILGSTTHRPQIFGSTVRIPPAYVADLQPEGRGVLVGRSSVVPIQVPAVSEADIAALPNLAPGLPHLLQRAAEQAGVVSTVSQVRSILRELRAAGQG